MQTSHTELELASKYFWQKPGLTIHFPIIIGPYFYNVQKAPTWPHVGVISHYNGTTAGNSVPFNATQFVQLPTGAEFMLQYINPTGNFHYSVVGTADGRAMNRYGGTVAQGAPKTHGTLTIVATYVQPTYAVFSVNGFPTQNIGEGGLYQLHTVRGKPIIVVDTIQSGTVTYRLYEAS